MHPHSQMEEEAIQSEHYGIELQLYVDQVPQGTAIDMESYLGSPVTLSATITADLEQPVIAGDIRLHLGKDATNLSPYMSTGARAFDRPLFDPGLYVSLYARCVGLNAGSPDPESYPFRPIFVGRIDAADPTVGEDVLELQCRDVFADVLDTWIEPSLEGWTTTDGMADEVLLELLSIADASGNVTSGGLSDTPFGVIGSVPLLIPSFPVGGISTLLLMRETGLQSGWDLRGRFGTPPFGPDRYVLTYYPPDRALSGAPSILGPNRYLGIRRMPKSRDEVRNVVEVTPSDPPRTPIKLLDEVSIAKYSRRYLGVSEDVSSHIQTPDQTLALGRAILSDTKEPKIMAEIETRFLPFVEINDFYILDANNVHHDEDLPLAISGFTHTLTEDGDGTTTLRTRDLPAAANSEWRRGEAKKQYISTEPPTGMAARGARWSRVSA